MRTGRWVSILAAVAMAGGAVSASTAGATAKSAVITSGSTVSAVPACAVSQDTCKQFELKSWDLGAALRKIGQLHDPDLAYVIPDYEHAKFVIYRKGGAPNRIYTLALSEGYPITFAESSRTDAEVTKEMDILWAARPQFKAIGVNVVRMLSNWPGPVQLGIDDTSPEAAAKATALAQALTPYGPDSVEIISGGTQVGTGRRQTNVSPFTGGNDTFSATGLHTNGRTGPEECSSAFGGVSTTNLSRYIITAAHCLKPGDPRMWVTAGGFMGTASVVDTQHDIAYLLLPAGSSTLPRVWIDGTPEIPSYKPIVDSGSPYIGYRVYFTGGTSNTKGPATVSGTSRTSFSSPFVGGPTFDGVFWYADSDSGGHIVADGDSGGAFVHPTASFDNGLIATGLQSNVNTGDRVGCASGTPAGVTCYRRAFFTDVHTEATRNHNIDFTR